MLIVLCGILSSYIIIILLLLRRLLLLGDGSGICMMAFAGLCIGIDLCFLSICVFLSYYK